MKEVIYFYGEHCPQCKAVKPKIEKECSEKNINVTMIDAEKDNQKVSEYGVRGIPYVVVLEDENIVTRGHAMDFVGKL